MTGKGMPCRLAVGVFVGGMLCAQLASAAPWDNLNIISAKKIEADPNKNYGVTEQNGPWMILACSFSGEGAQDQAKELVLELRSKFKLLAFMHETKFDYGKVEGRGLDRYGNPVKMRYAHGSNGREEWGVLVGNYASIDDPEGQVVLKKIKYAQPDCLQIKEGKKNNRDLSGWRMLQKIAMENEAQSKRDDYHRDSLPFDSKQKTLGPMGHAMMTTNPLLPRDYFTPKGVDRLVEKANEAVEYSLLKCPGKYSVQVAHFTGRVVIDPKEIQAITTGQKKWEGQLESAEMNAHLLTEALRRKGYEAYEFHDRAASIVTIGSYDSVGTPREDGKIEINPEIYKVIRTFGAAEENLSGDPNGGVKAKAFTLDNGTPIPFDPRPIPVEVPRRSVAADFRPDFFGRH